MSDKAKLQDLLSTFWDTNVLEIPPEVGEPDEAIPVKEPLIPLDSITAVVVLIDIEELVGKKLPIEKIVRKGGYSSKEQFVHEVMAAVDEFCGGSP